MYATGFGGFVMTRVKCAFSFNTNPIRGADFSKRVICCRISTYERQADYLYVVFLEGRCSIGVSSRDEGFYAIGDRDPYVEVIWE